MLLRHSAVLDLRQEGVDLNEQLSEITPRYLVQYLDIYSLFNKNKHHFRELLKTKCFAVYLPRHHFTHGIREIVVKSDSIFIVN